MPQWGGVIVPSPAATQIPPCVNVPVSYFEPGLGLAAPGVLDTVTGRALLVYLQARARTGMF